MSEFMREAIPIIVMYGFVLLLAPFIGFAMWMALDGDRDHSVVTAREAAAPAGAPRRITTPPSTVTAEHAA
ncbi:MAG: hypothetical protein JWM86_2692 [Thermoleophilia bacterium]|nr:hypothetical protein [Thermoleophilia bacterium]